MNLKTIMPLAVSILALSACSDSTDFNFQANLENAQMEALATAAPGAVFDPANGELPFPNSLLFTGTADGTLNIPLDEGVAEDDFGQPTVALNTLDGFSVTEPITSAFGNTLNADTAVLGESVFIFEVTTNAAGLVTAVNAELGPTDVFTTVVGGNTVAIVPLVPLQESTDYMMIVTNGLAGANGLPASPSVTFQLVAGAVELTGDVLGALEPLRIAVNAMLDAAEGQGVDRASVVQAWTTKTQSITPVMQEVANASLSGGAITIAPTGLTTNNINEALPGIADVFIGTLDIPYYRTPPANPNDVVGISSFWRGQGGSFLTRFNTIPVATSVQTIPVLMTVPNASSGQPIPAAGWPVAIFVHGITNDRTNALAFADSMAQAGFAVVAIDQAMHGITDATSPLAAANSPFPTDVERTFDIDLVNNETGAPGPDGVVDGSGTHFNSPAQLLASRDNLRQSAADLLVLSASLGNITAVPVDVSRKAVIGHSLGGTTATTFAAFDNTLSSVSLGMPAAGLVRVLVESPTFSPPLLAGLSAVGLEQGTPEFSQFIVAAQTAIDSGDPINFGARAASMHPIHMIEVIGDGESVPPDNVVPNTVPGAPLAGTEALAGVMGLLPAVTAQTDGSGLVQFIAGDHASYLSPATSLDATIEMQSQVATFAATSGTLIPFTNTAVINTTEP